MNVRIISIDNIKNTLSPRQRKVIVRIGSAFSFVGFALMAVAIFDFLLITGAPILVGDVEFQLSLFLRPTIEFFSAVAAVFIGFTLVNHANEAEVADWETAAKSKIDADRKAAADGGFRTSTEMISASFVDRIFVDRTNREILAYVTGDLEDESMSLTAHRLNFDDINDVNIISEPQNVNVEPNGSLNYTIGGMMLGGIGGIVIGSLVGSLVEGLTGPKQIDFKFNVRFGLVDGSEFTFKGVGSRFGVTSDNVEEFKRSVRTIVSREETYLKVLSRFFADKLSDGK